MNPREKAMLFDTVKVGSLIVVVVAAIVGAIYLTPPYTIFAAAIAGGIVGYVTREILD